MITCRKPLIRTVFLTVIGFFLFAFSALAQKGPAPNIGDPLPTEGDPLPKAGDPLPTEGDSEKNNPLPTPGPSTGDFKFGEGEDPLIFPEPDDKEQVFDLGKNDPLTPSVPEKDDPSVDSPKLVVDPLPGTGKGSKESNEKGSTVEKKQIEGPAGKDKESTDWKKAENSVFVAIVRTLEVSAEKGGSYLFGGKILADGGSNILGVGIELSLSMNFRKSTSLSFTLRAGKSSYQVKTENLESGTTYFYRAYVRNSVGRNVGSVKKLKVPALASKGGWWSDGEKLGAGWRKSKWFGTYRKQAGMDWVYHEKLGWTYVVGDQRDGLWLWQEENGWAWTQAGAWPCLWLNKTGTWLCLMGAYEGKPVFYDYAARKVRNRPGKQEKAKDSDSKAKSEKAQSSKEQDRKTEQASKDKAGEKVSGKTTDPSKPADSKTTNSQAKDSVENKSTVSEPSRTEQTGKAKDSDGIDSSMDRESSGSNREQADDKDNASDGKVSDGKVPAGTDDRKNGDRVTQSASSDSKTGDGKASDSNTNVQDSAGSRNGDPSRGETTQSGDRAGESLTDDPARTDTPTGSR